MAVDDHDLVTRIRRSLAQLAWAEGSTPTNAVFEALYNDLRQLARSMLAAEFRPTIDSCELVHEVFLRVKGKSSGRGPEELLRYVARAMRHFLVDRARYCKAQKREHIEERTALSGIGERHGYSADELIDLDAALTTLGDENERQLSVVELRFFAGLTMEEIAKCLDVSLGTIERDNRLAKAKLSRLLASYDAD